MQPTSSFEQLYCTLLYLMTRQAREPQKHIPGVIQDHLRWLSDHLDADEFPALRATCNRLALHWKNASDRTGDKQVAPACRLRLMH